MARACPLPAYATEHAAGMDVVAAEDVTLRPGARHAVATGFAIAIPEGYEVQVRPRSGLALKHGITCLNTPGTIDADYRGEVKVILANLGTAAVELARGERIAQLVPAPVQRATFVEVAGAGRHRARRRRLRLDGEIGMIAASALFLAMQAAQPATFLPSLPPLYDWRNVQGLSVSVPTASSLKTRSRSWRWWTRNRDAGAWSARCPPRATSRMSTWSASPSTCSCWSRRRPVLPHRRRAGAL